MRSTSLALAASLLTFVLIAACGGKTLTGGDTGPGGGGGATTGGGGTGTNTTTTGSTGGSCINIELSAYDTSCVQDTDCISVNVGQVCSGACLCGGLGAISASAQAQYNAALSSIQTDDTCPCPYPGPVACVEGQCTQCSFGPNDPPGCPGNGPDSGLEVDTGIILVSPEGGASTDSGACVNVDLSTYDTSCTQDSDCVEIASGEICPRTTCYFCGGSAVNVSEQARYNAAIAPIVAADAVPTLEPFACGCPFFGNPACVAGQCTLCIPNFTDGGCASQPK